MDETFSCMNSKRRITYSKWQLEEMEKEFQRSQYPNTRFLVEFSTKLCIPLVKLRNWFQNRRTRMRRRSMVTCMDRSMVIPCNRALASTSVSQIQTSALQGRNIALEVFSDAYLQPRMTAYPTVRVPRFNGVGSSDLPMNASNHCQQTPIMSHINNQPMRINPCGINQPMKFDISRNLYNPQLNMVSPLPAYGNCCRPIYSTSYGLPALNCGTNNVISNTYTTPDNHSPAVSQFYSSFANALYQAKLGAYYMSLQNNMNKVVEHNQNTYHTLINVNMGTNSGTVLGPYNYNNSNLAVAPTSSSSLVVANGTGLHTLYDKTGDQILVNKVRCQSTPQTLLSRHALQEKTSNENALESRSKFQTCNHGNKSVFQNLFGGSDYQGKSMNTPGFQSTLQSRAEFQTSSGKPEYRTPPVNVKLYQTHREKRPVFQAETLSEVALSTSSTSACNIQSYSCNLLEGDNFDMNVSPYKSLPNSFNKSSVNYGSQKYQSVSSRDHCLSHSQDSNRDHSLGSNRDHSLGSNTDFPSPVLGYNGNYFSDKYSKGPLLQDSTVESSGSRTYRTPLYSKRFGTCSLDLSVNSDHNVADGSSKIDQFSSNKDLLMQSSDESSYYRVTDKSDNLNRKRASHDSEPSDLIRHLSVEHLTDHSESYRNSELCSSENTDPRTPVMYGADYAEQCTAITKSVSCDSNHLYNSDTSVCSPVYQVDNRLNYQKGWTDTNQDSVMYNVDNHGYNRNPVMSITKQMSPDDGFSSITSNESFVEETESSDSSSADDDEQISSSYNSSNYNWSFESNHTLSSNSFDGVHIVNENQNGGFDNEYGLKTPIYSNTCSSSDNIETQGHFEKMSAITNPEMTQESVCQNRYSKRRLKEGDQELARINPATIPGSVWHNWWSEGSIAGDDQESAKIQESVSQTNWSLGRTTGDDRIYNTWQGISTLNQDKGNSQTMVSGIRVTESGAGAEQDIGEYDRTNSNSVVFDVSLQDNSAQERTASNSFGTVSSLQDHRMQDRTSSSQSSASGLKVYNTQCRAISGSQHSASAVQHYSTHNKAISRNQCSMSAMQDYGAQEKTISTSQTSVPLVQDYSAQEKTISTSQTSVPLVQDYSAQEKTISTSQTSVPLVQDYSAQEKTISTSQTSVPLVQDYSAEEKTISTSQTSVPLVQDYGAQEKTISTSQTSVQLVQNYSARDRATSVHQSLVSALQDYSAREKTLSSSQTSVSSVQPYSAQDRQVSFPQSFVSSLQNFSAQDKKTSSQSLVSPVHDCSTWVRTTTSPQSSASAVQEYIAHRKTFPSSQNLVSSVQNYCVQNLSSPPCSFPAVQGYIARQKTLPSSQNSISLGDDHYVMTTLQETQTAHTVSAVQGYCGMAISAEQDYIAQQETLSKTQSSLSPVQGYYCDTTAPDFDNHRPAVQDNIAHDKTIPSSANSDTMERDRSVDVGIVQDCSQTPGKITMNDFNDTDYSAMDMDTERYIRIEPAINEYISQGGTTGTEELVQNDDTSTTDAQCSVDKDTLMHDCNSQGRSIPDSLRKEIIACIRTHEFGNCNPSTHNQIINSEVEKENTDQARTSGLKYKEVGSRTISKVLRSRSIIVDSSMNCKRKAVVSGSCMKKTNTLKRSLDTVKRGSSVKQGRSLGIICSQKRVKFRKHVTAGKCSCTNVQGCGLRVGSQEYDADTDVQNVKDADVSFSNNKESGVDKSRSVDINENAYACTRSSKLSDLEDSLADGDINE